MSSYRLPAPAGERLDRSSSIAFRFNGEALHGVRGRYARIGAARQRRAARRSQLQAAPTARNYLLRRRGADRPGRHRLGRPAHAERARDAPRAPSRSRGAQRQLLAERWLRLGCTQRLLLRALARRLLLQNVQVAELASVRALDPPYGGLGPWRHASSIPTATMRYPSRRTSRWSAAASRGLRLHPPRRAQAARTILMTSGAHFGGALRSGERCANRRAPRGRGQCGRSHAPPYARLRRVRSQPVVRARESRGPQRQSRESGAFARAPLEDSCPGHRGGDGRASSARCFFRTMTGRV